MHLLCWMAWHCKEQASHPVHQVRPQVVALASLAILSRTDLPAFQAAAVLREQALWPQTLFPPTAATGFCRHRTANSVMTAIRKAATIAPLPAGQNSVAMPSSLRCVVKNVTALQPIAAIVSGSTAVMAFFQMHSVKNVMTAMCAEEMGVPIRAGGKQ